MESQQLKSVIESILFVSNKPLSVKELSKMLEQQAFSIQAALDQLAEERKESGIIVLENNGEYQLATNSHNSTQVKNFLNAELREKLTDATVEVLAIIAYRQPISKAEIEAIRGVNSQYSIRHLLMRGMIEKVPNPNDARGFLYKTTTEFLQHMGIGSVKELPDFSALVSQIKLPEVAQTQDTMVQPEEPQPEPILNPTNDTNVSEIIADTVVPEESGHIPDDFMQTPETVTPLAPPQGPEIPQISEAIKTMEEELEDEEEFDDEDEEDEEE